MYSKNRDVGEFCEIQGPECSLLQLEAPLNGIINKYIMLLIASPGSKIWSRQ